MHQTLLIAACEQFAATIIVSVLGLVCALFRQLLKVTPCYDPKWWAAKDEVLLEARQRGINSDKMFHADGQHFKLREAHDLWEKDPAKAFELFLILAESGSVWSMLAVAHAYWVGRGVARNPEQSEWWARAAHEGGSDVGLLEAAWFARQRGDVAAARELLKVGVGRSLAAAMTDLGQLELKAGRAEVARPLLERAAELGDFRASISLARAMVIGRYGIRAIPSGFQLLRRTVREISEAADAKNSTARNA